MSEKNQVEVQTLFQVMIKTMLLPIKYQLIFSVHVPSLKYMPHDSGLNNNY